jgi:hypothetical protein
MSFDYEFEDDGSWRAAGRRKRVVFVTFITVAVTVLLVGFGTVVYALNQPQHQPTVSGNSQVDVADTASSGAAGLPSPTPPPTEAVTSAPAPTTGAPTPARTTPKPKVSKSLVKPKETAVPPAPPAPAPSGCKPSYTGTNAPHAGVKTALDSAADFTFWKSSAQIKVPSKILYAFAYQESGWQSAILACDGGIGTMQVMPDTAAWMNQRFGTTFDIHTLSGNTLLGAEYIAWLTKYFGDQFPTPTYDLLASDKSLLNAVVSAYNYGFGAVDLSLGWDGIPNKQYVTNVEALIQSCPCTASSF